MNLLRFRPIERTVKIGGRKVKVSISDNHVVQHVLDGDVQHATAAPPTTIITKAGPANPGTPFRHDVPTGLWIPLEGERG